MIKTKEDFSVKIKKITHTRMGAALLATLLMLSVMSVFTLTSEALTPSYSFSDAYTYSPYYQKLIAYELTGDHRFDVLSVAFTQLGYHEGNSEADMDGLNLSGDSNFVEYNRLYGKLDNGEGNGTSYGYAWCAAFVSWCLRQAGIKKSVATTAVSCRVMTSWYQSKSQFKEHSSGYTPIAGDIIMFVNEIGSTTANHVGLVVGVKDGYVYTVEGNSGGEVATHKYSLTHEYILGYCVPKYTVNEGTDYSAFPLKENETKPGSYVTTASSLNVRTGAGTSYDKIGELPKNSSVTIIEIRNGWGQIEFNGQMGWISMSYVKGDADTVYSITYNFNGGKDGLTRQRMLKDGEIIIADKIPTFEGYQFVGWATSKDATEAKYKAGDKYNENKDLTLYAVWTPITYTVQFLDDDGNVILSTEYKHGDTLTQIPETPTKASDESFTYAFEKWDAEIATTVTSDLIYRAVYTKTPIEPATEAPTDPAEPTDQPNTNTGNGCKSSIVSVGAATVLIIAAASALVIKKKDDER